MDKERGSCLIMDKESDLYILDIDNKKHCLDVQLKIGAVISLYKHKISLFESEKKCILQDYGNCDEFIKQINKIYCSKQIEKLNEEKNNLIDLINQLKQLYYGNNFRIHINRALNIDTTISLLDVHNKERDLKIQTKLEAVIHWCEHMISFFNVKEKHTIDGHEKYNEAITNINVTYCLERIAELEKKKIHFSDLLDLVKNTEFDHNKKRKGDPLENESKKFKK
jgi:hypothetical protein